MKKKLLLSIIIFISIIAMYNIKSLASFYIENYNINCELTEDGDLKVQENIIYNTDEYKNGVTRKIVTKNERNTKNSADLMKLESVKVDGEEYTRVTASSNGRSGVYEYNIDGDEYNIKVYSPFKRMGKTVTYEYTLKNVAVKYKDTAELYWNFIGNEWDTSISKLEINITLPYNANKNNIYVFGHGSDNGTFEKNGNNIKLVARSLKAGQAVDARILFDKDAIVSSKKVINKNVLQSYIKDEEEGFRKERDAVKLFGIATSKQIAITLIVIIIITWIVIYFIFDKEYDVKPEKYYRDMPYDFDPDFLQYIYYGKEQKNTLWVTFLCLVQKGVYTIERATNKVGVETYKIIFNKEAKDMKEYQRDCMKLLNSFMTTADGEKSIDLLTLKSKMKNSTNSKYRQYINNLEYEKESIFGETEKPPKIVKIISIAIMAIIIILATIMAIATGAETPVMIIFMLTFTTFLYEIFFKQIDLKNAFLLIFFFLHFSAFQGGNIAILADANIAIMYIPYILAFIFIQYTLRIKREPRELREAKWKIKGLRNYIKDYSLLSNSQLEEIAIWEKYFITAVALHVNKKAINYLYDYCNSMTDNINFANSLSACGTYAVLSTTMRAPFTSYVSSYVYSSGGSSRSGSSFSGHSGGFSGGSSSGGGGRRWRRRKFLLNLKE